MWLFNKLKKRNRDGVWIECPIEHTEVKAGQKYVVIPKNKYLDLTIKNARLKSELEELKEAM